MREKKLLYKIRRKIQVMMYDITSPEFMSKLYFRIALKYNLNLKEPKSFNEKLQWLKLYEWPNSEIAIQCADKYMVREYLKKMDKNEILNELYFVWDNVEQINWKKLPNQFVLKCNHGCGYNIICKDKNLLDESETKQKLKKWMSEDFSKFNAEPHYSKIKRKIICEKYLEGEIINYNLYVINGKVLFLSVAGGLGDGIGEHLTYYYPDGKIANFKNRAYPTKNNKLTHLLPKMIETAEYLGKNLPMVRVDLFDIKGKIVFSEMTFTPGGALIPIEPTEMDFKLGRKLDITDEIEKFKTKN